MILPHFLPLSVTKNCLEFYFIFYLVYIEYLIYYVSGSTSIIFSNMPYIFSFIYCLIFIGRRDIRTTRFCLYTARVIIRTGILKKKYTYFSFFIFLEYNLVTSRWECTFILIDVTQIGIYFRESLKIVVTGG